MSTFRDNYALGIDLSSYQDTVRWDILKNGGVSFVFARASYGTDKDVKFAEHVQGGYDVGIPVLAYHAVNPGYYVYKLNTLDKLRDLNKWLPAERDEQFMALVNAMKNKKVYGLAVDFEIYTDYNGGVIPEMWLWEIALQFSKRVRAYFPQYQLFFYTGAWFVWNYCKTIETMGGVPDTKLWIAFYPYDKTTISTTWEDIKLFYPPETMTVNFPDGKRQTQNPPFLGWNGWKFWQFSGDKFKLPGILAKNGLATAVDLNFYNGTKDALYKEIGFSGDTGNVPVPPSPGDTSVSDYEKRLSVLEEKVNKIVDFLSQWKGV